VPVSASCLCRPRAALGPAFGRPAGRFRGRAATGSDAGLKPGHRPAAARVMRSAT